MSTNEFAAFEALDLAPIKMKLMHVESGEGWSALRAEAVEMEYRRFLFLMKKHPDAEASPTVDVDTFWHYHILDTMKYARDCETVFGYFLHHYPYVGIGEGTDDSERLSGGERMRALYEAEFGTAADVQTAWCTVTGKEANASAWCTVTGKNADASAWCTVTGKNAGATAWCTVTGKNAGATAWCTVTGKNAGATAWCTAPGKSLVSGTIGQVAAWCTAPGKPRAAANDANAWCTAPGKKIDTAAWCTAPGKKIDTSAWCTAPGKKVDATAWCTAPGKPREAAEAANAANAWCTAPGKALDAGAAGQAAWCTAPGKQAQVQAA